MAAGVPNGLKPQKGSAGGLPKALDSWAEPDTIYSMSGAVKVLNRSSWAGRQDLQGKTC